MAMIPKLDEYNNIIGETRIDEAKRNNWPRRIVRVFLFDEQGSLLLQLRSSKVVSFPNLWDQSAGGHVDVGETEAQAAARELAEELGVTNVSLELVAAAVRSDRPDDNVFSYIYRALLPHGGTISPNPKEVSDTKWFSISEFEEEITTNPDQFVPTFIGIYQKYRDTLVQ